jgi:hypothetical protein
MPSKHTPGPWYADDLDEGYGIWDATGALVARTHRGMAHDATLLTAEQEAANAALLKAAPDLYQALDGLIAEHDDHWRKHCAENVGHYPPEDTGGMVLARMAIAKARGEL